MHRHAKYMIQKQTIYHLANINRFVDITKLSVCKFKNYATILHLVCNSLRLYLIIMQTHKPKSHGSTLTAPHSAAFATTIDCKTDGV